MIVFRVETDDMTGPYRVRESAIALRHHCSLKRTPRPDSDGITVEAVHKVFGRKFYIYDVNFAFSSIESFFKWFAEKKERDFLRDSGCKITIIQCDKSRVLVGNSGQCVFVYSESNPLKRITINDSLPYAKRKVKKILRELDIAA
jgi:hypothetical protein